MEFSRFKSEGLIFMKIWKIRSVLYSSARILGDFSAILAIFRGDYRKAANRGKNKLIGRTIGRSSLWKKWL